MNYRVRMSIGAKISWGIIISIWLAAIYGLYQLTLTTDGGSFKSPEEATLFGGAIFSLVYFGVITEMFKSNFKRSRHYVRSSDQKILKEKDFEEATLYVEEQLFKSVIYKVSVSLNKITKKDLSYSVYVYFKEECKEQYNLFEIKDDLTEQTAKAIMEKTGCCPSRIKVIFHLGYETSFTS